MNLKETFGSKEMSGKQSDNRVWIGRILAVCVSYIITGYVCFPVDAWKMAGIMIVTFLLYVGVSLCFMVRYWKIRGHWLKIRDILQHFTCYAWACLAGVLAKTDLFCRCFYDMSEEEAEVLGVLIQCLLLLGTIKVWIVTICSRRTSEESTVFD